MNFTNKLSKLIDHLYSQFSQYESWSYLAVNNAQSDHVINITLDYTGTENMKVRSPIVDRNVEILDFKLPIGQKAQFLGIYLFLLHLKRRDSSVSESN